MRILGFESSAKAASVALLTDGLLTAESFLNCGLTHSVTLMQLARDLLKACGLSPADLDAAAWANGPGSFTGVRIGAAAAKGLCWGAELPGIPVSTLAAMAWSAAALPGVICCCMDARRNQVYNALFRGGLSRPERLTPDRAISIAELAEDLERFQEPVYFVGDGAALACGTLNVPGPEGGSEVQAHTVRPYRLMPEFMRQQRASGVVLAAWEAVQAGALSSGAPGGVYAVPNYLRLSQAERERLAREVQA